jgi:hypothetical protein
MPIRFRCAYCNQLMGIARRKAGSIVSCPGCQRQLIVPTLEPQQGQPLALPPAPSIPKSPKKSPFERPDFEAALFEPHQPKTQGKGGHNPTTPGSLSQEYDVQPVALPPPGPVPGPQPLVLGPKTLYWWLLLLGALALALGAFGAGFAVGRL